MAHQAAALSGAKSEIARTCVGADGIDGDACGQVCSILEDSRSWIHQSRLVVRLLCSAIEALLQFPVGYSNIAGVCPNDKLIGLSSP